MIFFFKDKIQTRIFNIDEEQLCYGVPNIIFPKKAKNLKDEWVWVVNVDNYTQSVEVEECDNSTVAEDLGRDQLVGIFSPWFVINLAGCHGLRQVPVQWSRWQRS